MDELLERLRLAEADARDSAAARAASSPADDVDVDGVAASRAATHAESDAFHDARAPRERAWALQASGRAAASARGSRNPVSREIDAVAPSAAVRVRAMLVRAARRTGRLERAARVLDRAEAIVTRAEAILPRAAEADATLTDATARLDAGDGVSFETDPPDPAESDRARRADAVARLRGGGGGRRRAGISRGARLSLARARPADVDDVSARLDALEKEMERERGDAKKETYLEAFIGETRVLGWRRRRRATRFGRDASVDGRARDVSRVARACSNLAEAFRRAGVTRRRRRALVDGAESTKDAREERTRERTRAERRTPGRRTRERTSSPRRVRGADGRTTRRRGVGVRVARVENPGDVASIGGVRRRARDGGGGGEGGAETCEEERYGDVSARAREYCLGHHRLLGLLLARVWLFGRRRRALLGAREGRRRTRVPGVGARGGGCESRLRESTPRATSRRPRARRDALATRGWMGRRRRRERENEDADAWMSKFGASTLDALTVDERRAYARVGRCYAAEALFALGRFDESKRITRDAAARDDADFETLTHAARAAYAVGEVPRGGCREVGEEGAGRRRRAAEPRLTVAFPASGLGSGGEKGR